MRGRKICVVGLVAGETLIVGRPCRNASEHINKADKRNPNYYLQPSLDQPLR
jgi:hypothetical protein